MWPIRSIIRKIKEALVLVFKKSIKFEKIFYVELNFSLLYGMPTFYMTFIND